MKGLIKELIRGLIIGLAIVLIIAGTVFYKQQQEKKAFKQLFEQLGKESTPEEVEKQFEEMWKKQEELACKQLVVTLKSEDRCQQLKVDIRDGCYLCFAVEKKDLSICEKISKEAVRNDCKEQFMKAGAEERELKKIPNWSEVYSDFLLPAEVKEFLNKVFEETGKYPTEKSTKEEKKYYIEKCDALFPNITIREECYYAVVAFTKDESLWKK